MNNAARLFDLAFNNKNKLDRLYGSGKYRLVADTFADADKRDENDLPPVLVAIGDSTQPPDLYAYVELSKEVPKRGKIDIHQTDEAMLLRIVADRLAVAKADSSLISQIKELIPRVQEVSKRAARQPDPVPKPKKDEKPPVPAPTK